MNGGSKSDLQQKMIDSNGHKIKQKSKKEISYLYNVVLCLFSIFLVLLVLGLLNGKIQSQSSRFPTILKNENNQRPKPQSYKKFVEEFKNDKVQPINGSVFEEGIIQRALKARSKAKEIIIQAIDFDAGSLYERAEIQFNALQNLFNLNYDNVLAVSITKYSCDKIMEMYPNMGCLYGDFIQDIPELKTSNVTNYLRSTRNKIWTLRYMVMFKAVQHGYNAMILDSDAHITRDVYKSLKSEQMSDYQWIAAVDYGLFLNGGFQYVQNALPNGPVAWSIFQVPYYTLRITEEATKDTIFTIEDQKILTNALFACLSGKPLYKNLRYTGYWVRDKLDSVKWEALEQISEYVPTLYRKFKSYNFDSLKDQTNTLNAYSVDKKYRRSQPEMANETIIYNLEYYDLTLPRMEVGESVSETSDQFKQNIGQATKWLLRFASENGTFKLWPDEYVDETFGGMYKQVNASTEEASYREFAKEKMVLAPKMIYDEFCYDSAGMRQMFQSDGDQGLVSSCGVCHFNCLGGSWGQEDRKELMKHFGWWNWDTMLRLHEGKIFRNFSGNTSSVQVPKLFAINPKLQISVENKKDLSRYVNELRKFAAAVDRRLVWPYISCESAMFSKNENFRTGISQSGYGEFQIFGNSSFGCDVLWEYYLHSHFMNCGFSPGDFIYYQQITNYKNNLTNNSQLTKLDEKPVHEQHIQAIMDKSNDTQVILIDYLPIMSTNTSSEEHRRSMNAFTDSCGIFKD